MTRTSVLAIALTCIMPIAASAGTTTTNDDGVEVIVTSPDHAAATPAKKKPARARATATNGSGFDDGDPSGVAGDLINAAMALVGRPYVFGGTTPAGFDCSGYVQYAYARIGIHIPRTADAQFAAGRPVSDPLPGDLLFFQTYDYGASHVALYLGDGSFVNAIGHDVHVANFDSPYFRGRYLGARRFLPT